MEVQKAQEPLLGCGPSKGLRTLARHRRRFITLLRIALLAKFTLPALAMIGALLLTSAALAAFGGAAAWPAWTIAGGTALIASVLAAMTLFSVKAASPRKVAVCFFLVSIGGALFLSTSGLSMPASLPIWIWTILGIGMATIGLVEDADTAQSTPKNRL